MRVKALILALGVVGLCGAVSAQETSTTTTRETTVQNPDGSVTVTGSVVRYTPGQTIVIHRENKDVTYQLSNVSVPPDVSTGRNVTLYLEPSSTRVTRVTVGPTGETSSTTTEYSSDMQPVIIEGTVQAYEPGRSVTVVQPDGSTITYTVSAQSALPPDLAVGKTVTVTTKKVSGSPFAEKVTYTTKTKTKIKK